MKPKKKWNKILFSFLITSSIFLIGFFVYNKISLNKEIAKEEAQRLFSLMSIENPNQMELEKLYPNYSKMGQRLILKGKIDITDISKNSSGNYDVFATYNNNYKIYLEIGRENFSNKIINTKGLSYYYYNQIRNYGIKKGCLTGNENDIELGQIVKKKDLESNLNINYAAKIAEFYDNIKKSENIYESGGYFPTLNGNVTVTNNNNIYLDYSSIKCNLLILDNNGNTIDSKPLYLFNTIKPHTSESANVFATIPSGASSYKVEFDVNISENISNLLKEEVIQNISENCE